DDGTAALARHHRPSRGLRAEERPLEIHVEDEVPVLFAHLEERDAGIDAGVVDEDVQAAERLHHAPQHLLDLRQARYVARDERRARARLSYLRGDALSGRPVVEIVDPDVGAVTSKRDRHAATDSLLGP